MTFYPWAETYAEYLARDWFEQAVRRAVAAGARGPELEEILIGVLREGW